MQTYAPHQRRNFLQQHGFTIARGVVLATNRAGCAATNCWVRRNRLLVPAIRNQLRRRPCPQWVSVVARESSRIASLFVVPIGAPALGGSRRPNSAGRGIQSCCAFHPGSASFLRVGHSLFPVHASSPAGLTSFRYRSQDVSGAALYDLADVPLIYRQWRRLEQRATHTIIQTATPCTSVAQARLWRAWQDEGLSASAPRCLAAKSSAPHRIFDYRNWTGFAAHLRLCHPAARAGSLGGGANDQSRHA